MCETSSLNPKENNQKYTPKSVGCLSDLGCFDKHCTYLHSNIMCSRFEDCVVYECAERHGKYRLRKCRDASSCSRSGCYFLHPNLGSEIKAIEHAVSHNMKSESVAAPPRVNLKSEGQGGLEPDSVAAHKFADIARESEEAKASEEMQRRCDTVPPALTLSSSLLTLNCYNFTTRISPEQRRDTDAHFKKVHEDVSAALAKNSSWTCLVCDRKLHESCFKKWRLRANIPELVTCSPCVKKFDYISYQFDLTKSRSRIPFNIGLIREWIVTAKEKLASGQQCESRTLTASQKKRAFPSSIQKSVCKKRPAEVQLLSDTIKIGKQDFQKLTGNQEVHLSEQIFNGFGMKFLSKYGGFEKGQALGSSRSRNIIVFIYCHKLSIQLIYIVCHLLR